MKPMKITINILILLVIISSNSCNYIVNSNDKMNQSDTNGLRDLEKNRNAEECITYTEKFLNWYKKNYVELNNIKLVVLIGSGDSIHYKINFKSVEQYILKLKKSNIFSDKYLTTMNDYFEKCNKNLINNYQSDGPPEGLEYDIILLTQEPDNLLNNIEKLDYQEIVKNKDCIVTIDNELKIEFDENNLIEKIFK